MTDRIIITFDVDTEQWSKTGGNWMFPLLVRMFDRNGEYLSHFSTNEAFVVKESVLQMYLAPWERLTKAGVSGGVVHKPVLLQEKGNRLEYMVNTRDMEHVEKVEIGFLNNVSPYERD